MYLPKHFAVDDRSQQWEFVRAHPFGLLVTQTTAAEPEILANPMPFLLHVDGREGDSEVGREGGRLLAHVARANPVWQQSDLARSCLVVFSGPEHYISPNWYPSKQVDGRTVPTWNYQMVQARGKLRVHHERETLLQVLKALTTEHESTQPKPWAIDDAPADYVEAMLRGIVVLEVVVESWQGKFKTSQNKTEADRRGVIAGLQSLGSDRAVASAHAVANTLPPTASPD